MKNLTLLTALVFTVTLSSPSYAEWTKVSEDADGPAFYVDFERIRKHDGYVYYWELTDILKPIQYGVLSIKVYKQGDCKLFRNKDLSVFFHKQPMGDGTSETFTPPDKWKSPPPTSVNEIILKAVCNH